MASLLPKLRPGAARLIFAPKNARFLCSSTPVLRAPEKLPGDVDQVPTHTGVVWEKDDYRLARFTETTREVNPNFAIDLIHKVPPKKVKARTVWCDGGDDKLGHPKVFINLDQPGTHSCGYCGLRYEREDDHH